MIWADDPGELAGHSPCGALLTHAPSTYKIPTANDTPPRFNTALYDAPNPADTIHRSKAGGLRSGFTGPGATERLRADGCATAATA